ncbi:MAG: cell division protein FtsL [Firmicutes bacterium]|nr:cell division protein FtsL [Bacillota bacterium]HOB34435.1 cell division protein FtsL [Bacillota bacterium]HPZ89825.1 cell division protein FtsL [Bacillota bacterium]HQE01159.1 cell division protein FtsL [Bacillota bacterium]
MVVANNAQVRIPKVYDYPSQRSQTVSRPRIKTRLRVNSRLAARVMAGVLIVAMALLVVYRYGQINQLNMEIRKDTNTLKALADEKKHLEITYSQLTALDRLEEIAIKELGLQHPHSEQVRFVGEIPERRDGDGE